MRENQRLQQQLGNMQQMQRMMMQYNFSNAVQQAYGPNMTQEQFDEATRLAMGIRKSRWDAIQQRRGRPILDETQLQQKIESAGKYTQGIGRPPDAQTTLPPPAPRMQRGVGYADRFPVQLNPDYVPPEQQYIQPYAQPPSIQAPYVQDQPGSPGPATETRRNYFSEWLTQETQQRIKKSTPPPAPTPEPRRKTAASPYPNVRYGAMTPEEYSKKLGAGSPEAKQREDDYNKQLEQKRKENPPPPQPPEVDREPQSLDMMNGSGVVSMSIVGPDSSRETVEKFCATYGLEIISSVERTTYEVTEGQHLRPVRIVSSMRCRRTRLLTAEEFSSLRTSTYINTLRVRSLTVADRAQTVLNRLRQSLPLGMEASVQGNLQKVTVQYPGTSIGEEINLTDGMTDAAFEKIYQAAVKRTAARLEERFAARVEFDRVTLPVGWTYNFVNSHTRRIRVYPAGSSAANPESFREWDYTGVFLNELEDRFRKDIAAFQKGAAEGSLKPEQERKKIDDGIEKKRLEEQEKKLPPREILPPLPRVLGSITVPTLLALRDNYVQVDLDPRFALSQGPALGEQSTINWTPDVNRLQNWGANRRREMERAGVRIRLLPGSQARVEFSRPGTYVVNGVPVVIQEGQTTQQTAEVLRKRDTNERPLHTFALRIPNASTFIDNQSIGISTSVPNVERIDAPSTRQETNWRFNLNFRDMTPDQPLRMRQLTVERPSAVNLDYRVHFYQPGDYYFYGRDARGQILILQQIRVRADGTSETIRDDEGPLKRLNELQKQNEEMNKKLEPPPEVKTKVEEKIKQEEKKKQELKKQEEKKQEEKKQTETKEKIGQPQDTAIIFAQNHMSRMREYGGGIENFVRGLPPASPNRQLSVGLLQTRQLSPLLPLGGDLGSLRISSADFPMEMTGTFEPLHDERTWDAMIRSFGSSPDTRPRGIVLVVGSNTSPYSQVDNTVNNVQAAIKLARARGIVRVDVVLVPPVMERSNLSLFSPNEEQQKQIHQLWREFCTGMGGTLSIVPGGSVPLTADREKILQSANKELYSHIARLTGSPEVKKKMEEKIKEEEKKQAEGKNLDNIRAEFTATTEKLRAAYQKLVSDPYALGGTAYFERIQKSLEALRDHLASYEKLVPPTTDSTDAHRKYREDVSQELKSTVGRIKQRIQDTDDFTNMFLKRIEEDRQLTKRHAELQKVTEAARKTYEANRATRPAYRTALETEQKILMDIYRHRSAGSAMPSAAFGQELEARNKAVQQALWEVQAEENLENHPNLQKQTEAAAKAYALNPSAENHAAYRKTLNVEYEALDLPHQLTFSFSNPQGTGLQGELRRRYDAIVKIRSQLTQEESKIKRAND